MEPQLGVPRGGGTEGVYFRWTRGKTFVVSGYVIAINHACPWIGGGEFGKKAQASISAEPRSRDKLRGQG